VAHNPVGQALAGAAAGFEAGGIPGAAAAIVVSTISAFRRPSRPPLFEPFRMALWGRFKVAFRPHFRAIGKASIDHSESIKEFGIATPAIALGIGAQDRRGINIVDEVFFTLSNHQAQAIIDGLAGGSLAVEGGELELVSSPGAIAPPKLLAPGQLPPLPTEGQMLDAKFTPGMDRELGLQEGEPPAVDPGIKRTIDLARWLVPEEIFGTGTQFFDATVAGAALFTLCRISAKPGKIIGIYNANLLVTQQGGAVNNRFQLKAGTVKTKDPGDTSGTYIRQHGQLRVFTTVGVTDNPTRESQKSLGPYVVNGGQDYVVGFNAEQAVNYAVSVAIMGYYFDEGMWPIGK